MHAVSAVVLVCWLLVAIAAVDPVRASLRERPLKPKKKRTNE